MKPRLLENPPLTEVVFDLRTTVSQDIKIEQLEELHGQMKKEYPEKKSIYIGQVELKNDKPGSILAKHLHSGFRFTSENGNRIVQCRQDGFTFNQLKHYPGWNDAIDEARKLWGLYKATLMPEARRVAVRSINKIEFPCFPDKILEYVSIFPKFPDDFPLVENSVVQSQFSYPGGIKAIITEKIIFESPITSFLLDIDVFLNFETGIIDEEHIWNSFDKIREIKNKVFFGCISEKGGEELK